MQTHRPTVESLENILYTPIPVLDHGFIRVIDYMGNDCSIVEAARVSYGQNHQTSDPIGIRRLLRYLMRHHHTTPFEMCDIKFHIKLPIFVARQWIRHRTASVNEYSARYSILSQEFYLPNPETICPQSTTNNQGREEGVPLSESNSQTILHILRSDAEQCHEHYKNMMEEYGVSRELARINLTLNHYTEWYWKVNLHNLLHFLQLRADSHAQYEIRVYADAILNIVKEWVPISYEAFYDYRLQSTTFSRVGMEILRQMIAGERPSFETWCEKISKREWNEIMAAAGGFAPGGGGQIP